MWCGQAVRASEATRREQLLAQWRRAGRFPLYSPQSNSKVALLTGTDASDKWLNMDLLSERAAMLADVRNAVSALKQVLAEVLSSVRVTRERLPLP